MPVIKYETQGDTIIWRNPVKGKIIFFSATSIRQERTGIHARISIINDSALLAWSYMNVEKSEERGRLSNQAHSRLTFEYSKEELRYDLDAFCVGLWNYLVSSDTAEMMTGEDTAPPSFYLYPYILQGGGTILFAPPGRGKSITAMLWAQSINRGVSTFWQVSQCPCLYINLERSSHSLKRRLAAVNRVLGLPADTALLTFNRRGQPLSVLVPNITRAVQEHGIKLIVLDSISRAGYGDLTENRPINLIIDTLSNLSDSWLALGHTPRADETHIYGGIMFEAGADIVIQLSSEPEAGKLGIKYEIVKSNDLPVIDSEMLSFEFEEWRLKSVSKAMPFEFAELETKHKPKMMPAIIDFILNQDSADASATEIANELGYNRQNVSEFLSKSGKFIKTRKVKQSQYYGVRENTRTLV